MDAKTLKALLDKSVLSNADKSKINKAYQSLTGRKINAGCSSCYRDAIIELHTAKRRGKQPVLRGGVVIEYEGQLYTRHSATLPEWILQNHKDKFENYDML